MDLRQSNTSAQSPQRSSENTENTEDTVELAFQAHCKERMVRQSRLVMGAVMLCNLLWWPLDWYVYAFSPADIPALIRCRSILMVISGLFLLATFVRGLRPHIFAAFTIAAAGCTFVAGTTAGDMGGPNSPNFHTLYVVVLATVPLPLTLPRRIFATSVLATALGVGLFIFHPEHLAARFATLCVSYLFFCMVASTGFGHIQYLLSRDNFRQAAQLAEYGRLLESRVADRTQELRRLLDSLETARELERTRISRELHDELGQELSALRYSLGFTKMRYDKDPLGIVANLEDLEDLLRRTAQTTRSLVTDLRPRVIDDLGLGAAVDWLVKRTEERSALVIDLSISGEIMALDERVAIAAFRLLQEALTNIMRHARASAVSIEIRADEAFVSLLVRDDGVGITSTRGKENEEETSGVGLLGMRERVNALGGEFWIGETQGHKGTEIRCRLPRAPLSGRVEKRLGAQA